MAIVYTNLSQLNKMAAILLSAIRDPLLPDDEQPVILNVSLTQIPATDDTVQFNYERNSVPYIAVIDRQGKILRARE